ncbi:MAG: response regulator [Anaerolineae bacterium]|jgi:DNA-binding response OmpR family regulator|nr:response regulator [Anaerolineae bacterium]MDH7474157.1 response regulator [Anaerolineae bacterium]
MPKPKGTVLCVEDEPEVIELIQVMLETAGYRVIGVLGGDEALQAMRRDRPDLVLLDLMMPGVDGWTVFKQMRADPELRDIPVVPVTAVDRHIDVVLALEVAGVDEYVTKPFGREELVASVEKVLRRRRNRED